MFMTLLGGLLLMTDDRSDPTYDPTFMGYTLVAINSLGFVALALSLVALHPKVRAWLEKRGNRKKTKEGTVVVTTPTPTPTSKILPVLQTQPDVAEQRVPPVPLVLNHRKAPVPQRAPPPVPLVLNHRKAPIPPPGVPSILQEE